MKNFFIKYKKRIIPLGVIILMALAYFIFSNKPQSTQYVTEKVSRGAVTSYITGSGQVSASNQIDIKPKVSGDVIYVPVSEGQTVGAGALIVQLDDTDAQKAVRDAQANLDSAKIALQKLQQPADALSITQAQNAIDKANESKQNAQSDLVQAYDSGFNSVSNSFLDLPTIMTGLQNVLYTNTRGLSPNGQNNIDYYTDAVAGYDSTVTQLKDDVTAKYNTARTAYNQNFDDYGSITRSSDPTKIEAIIEETYNTSKDIADAIKSANNLIQFYKDKLTEVGKVPSTIADTHLSILNNYTGMINGHLQDLLSIQNTIQSDKQAITDATGSIAESTQSLQQLQAGANPLDIQSAQLTIVQRQNALLDAQQALADYSIRAPFAATIAKLDVQKADSVSSGTVVATVITKQKIAEVSLNEVDASNVKVGQKATLTFDALPDVSLAGTVAQIDTLGTVSQGVVTYNTQIAFDSDLDTIKPGMSVTATIITNVKQDTLYVSNSAIKSQGSNQVVQVLNGDGTVSQKQVQTGISNDTVTEILSGLSEGDNVVTKTITGAAATTQTSQGSGFRIPGIGGGGAGGGGAVRRATGD